MAGKCRTFNYIHVRPVGHKTECFPRQLTTLLIVLTREWCQIPMRAYDFASLKYKHTLYISEVQILNFQLIFWLGLGDTGDIVFGPQLQLGLQFAV